MILIISHPEFTSRESFGNAFDLLEKDDLSVFLRTLRPGGEAAPKFTGEICLISVYGSDKPGIVYPVARELGERQINITDLNTKLVGPPERPVYVMMIEAVLPPGMQLEEIAAIMDDLKLKLQVDITVRDITPVEL
jgi:glycine cleavage system transcriptional repressor